MYKFSLKQSFFLLGVLWLFSGILLFSKGVRLLLDIQAYRLWPAKSEIIALLICIGLFLGQFKAKIVLRKAANKKILAMHSQGTLTFFQIFNFRYIFLIATMIFLGFLLKFSHTPCDIRGMINVTIGTALIQSSIFYFKAIQTQPKKTL